MVIAAAIGALVTLVGAIWLWRGFGPGNERYKDDGLLYPGQQESTVLPNLLRDRQKVMAVIAGGGAIQFVGSCLALVAVFG